MKIGKNQRGVLESLVRHGSWYRGCGWIWGTYSGTIRILDSLVKRGLVDTKQEPAPHRRWPIIVYRINPMGRDKLAGKD